MEDEAFPATRHTMVAGMQSTNPEVKRAGHDTLVSTYWQPVYVYLRIKWRATPVDAQDLTQEFFMRALEKSFFESYEPAKGRFRTFLRTCLDGFMSNQRKAERRLKRGGGVLPVALDFDDAGREIARHAVVDDANAEKGVSSIVSGFAASLDKRLTVCDRTMPGKARRSSSGSSSGTI